MTALEFNLFPVTDVYAGVLFFPLERGAEVLRAWRRWVDDVPDEVTSVGRFLQFPPIPDIPEPLRGGSFATIEGKFLMFAVALSVTPEIGAAVKAHVEVVQAALARWDSGRMYLNFAEKRERGERFFGDKTYGRLQAVKAAVDPDDVFRSNHPIRLPTTTVADRVREAA